MLDEAEYDMIRHITYEDPADLKKSMLKSKLNDSISHRNISDMRDPEKLKSITF